MDERVKILIMGDAESAKKAFKDARKASETTMLAITAAGAAMAGTFAIVGRAVLETSGMFERYKSQLETIEGSSAKAEASMQWITDFAVKTPYELDQVTQAFVSLRAYGIDPTDGTLKTLGDTAAAMGKPLQQAVEAMADAMTGENERLKEFGIKAKVVGDKIYYNWVDVSGRAHRDVADNNAKSIESTLSAIWNEKYAGGMDRLSQTWEGMLSNLGDNYTKFKANVGDQGSFNAAKNVLHKLLEEINNNDAAINDLAKATSDTLINGLEIGVTGAAMFAKGLAEVGVIADAIRVGIDELAGGAITGIDTILGGVDALYAQLEKLPGTLGQPYAQARQDISGMRAELGLLKTGIEETEKSSISKLLDDSVATKQAWDSIDEKAASFVATIEAGRNASTSGGSGESAPVDPITGQPVDQVDQALIDRYTKLDESLLSEEERLQMSYINRAQIVADAVDQGLVSEQRGMKIMDKLTAEHHAKMLKQSRSAASAKAQIESQAWSTVSSIAAIGGKKFQTAVLAVQLGIATGSAAVGAIAAWEKGMEMGGIPGAIVSEVAHWSHVAGLLSQLHGSSGGVGSVGQVASASNPANAPSNQSQPFLSAQQSQQPVEHVYQVDLRGHEFVSTELLRRLADQQAQDKVDGIVSRIEMTG